ncbi:sugar-binding protein [Acuticoccus sp. M5D2P5]|uniref:sugar-binding protein n=1 Tax=Acuticoccus kalidii TaxID=2910977 RepID=UPI001F17C7F3|nr:sugar-binding protein [Acuticoccus kalidii]MCF3933700.1 sugar-binding protein [Acuticoccus kalidii]
MQKRLFMAAVAAAFTATLSYAPAHAQAQNDKVLAFVTNAAADFWTIGRRGVEKAGQELDGYTTEMHVVSEATAAEQRRIIDDLLTRGVAGITVSVIDPANSRDLLNRVAEQAVLFTSDSDAPDTKRMLYVGTDNVAAGEQAGELIKKALPDGGDIMLFVGTMGAANAQERVQGIRNVLEGGNINIIDIRTDEVDFARAKRNVEDTLTTYPDIDGLVGLWSYNTPQIVEAVRAAGKTGQVKVIGFDEDPVTLRGIADGIVEATVVQQPFEFGYQSMINMAKVIEGDTSMIPDDGLMIIPTKVIDASNVEEFRKEMQALLSQ